MRSPPSELLPLMAKRNLRTLVDLTGGVGSGLAEAVRTFQQPHPDRFVVFTEPSYDRIAEPKYAAWQADELARAKAAGAKGVKISKCWGSSCASRSTAVRSSRWTTRASIRCGKRAARSACRWRSTVGSEAFFLPIDAHNERYEELNRHPDWSFPGRDYPSNAEILAARDRVLARHPKTTFIGLHVGHASEDWRRRPRRSIVSQPARRDCRADRRARPQPRAARRFFDKYQDRILFGTDGPRDALYRSISASSRPKTSTSTTAPARCPRRAAGRSTGSA